MNFKTVFRIHQNIVHYSIDLSTETFQIILQKFLFCNIISFCMKLDDATYISKVSFDCSFIKDAIVNKIKLYIRSF